MISGQIDMCPSYILQLKYCTAVYVLPSADKEQCLLEGACFGSSRNGVMVTEDPSGIDLLLIELARVRRRFAKYVQTTWNEARIYAIWKQDPSVFRLFQKKRLQKNRNPNLLRPFLALLGGPITY